MPDIPGDASTTTTIAVGGTLIDSLEYVGDRDWVRIELTVGQKIQVSLLSYGTTGGLPDPYLRLLNSSGVLLAENDDRGAGLNSSLVFTATTAGVYYLDVGAYNDAGSGQYQLQVTPYTPPPIGTVQQFADQLLYGYWGGTSRQWNVLPGGSLTVNISTLTPESQNLARNALLLWTDVTGIRFNEVLSGGQIRFQNTGEGAYSSSSRSGGFIVSSTINVANDWVTRYGTGLNTYSFQTFVHEIGHSLGLGHAGHYNESADYPDDALYENDSWQLSVMSYFSQNENTSTSSQGISYNLALTPQLADILAMSQLYGLSTTTRLGNTVYGFNSTAGRSLFDARQYPGISYTIIDSGGIDTLDYSGFSHNQRIDLNPGNFSNVGGKTGNVSIAFGTIIESAVGGGGNDTLIGNAVANYLAGGNGHDVLLGGAGADTMVGGVGNDTYEVDNGGDVVEELAGQGVDKVYAYADYTLSDNVENLDMSFGIQVRGTGNALDNRIQGNAENNVLYGLDGNDVLLGGLGADTMIGGSGNDFYEVDHTGDVVVEAAGGGTIDNVYAYVDFVLPTDVENLIMLYGNQRVGTGNAGNNIIIGNASANLLEGGAGYDTLTGGAGSDTFIIRAGFGVDVITDFQAGAGSEDSVLFSRSLFTTFAQVMANSAQVGNDTWIGDGLGNTLVLTGVSKAALHSDDFGFI